METVCRENRLLSRSVVIGRLQCLLTWWQLGLFSCALVLILHFQPPQGSDRDNKTKNEISRLRGEKNNCVGKNGIFCPSLTLTIWGCVSDCVCVVSFERALCSAALHLLKGVWQMPIIIYKHTMLHLELFLPVLLYLSYMPTFPSVLLMHSAFGDAWQMCTFEGGIGFLRGGKGVQA